MAHIGGVFRWGTTQTIAFTSTSVAQTTAFGAGTRVARIMPTTECHLAQAVVPTATTSSPKLAADAEYYIVVSPGEKLAAIRTATSGTLFVTECS
jgi:hypothetical protein